MRVRRIQATLAATGLVLALAACGGDDSGSGLGGTSGNEPSVDTETSFEAGTTMARLADAGTITVGTKFDQPLFGLQGLGGSPEGFDVEIAKIVAAGLGIGADDITYTETPSAVREEVIESGKADMVVATYTINDKRKERITFAGPYYIAGQTLMVKSDNDTITGPEDLKTTDATVCSVQGSTPAETIKQYTSKITLFDVYSKCADALRTGQVDAVTTDNVILLGLVSTSDGQFKIAGETFTDEPYGIGIKKGDTAFCEFINEQLSKAAADGSYLKAWKATAGAVEGAEDPTLPTLDPCS